MLPTRPPHPDPLPEGEGAVRRCPVAGVLLGLDQTVNDSLTPLRHGLPLAVFRSLTILGTEATAVPVAAVASGLLASGRRGRLVAPM